jgi:hypothetical protein
MPRLVPVDGAFFKNKKGLLMGHYIKEENHVKGL